MEPNFWSGWGIRTLPSDHPAYNPYSYHRGSVWPHDNALIALGFKRYGFADECARLARDVFEAASFFAGYRLPELYAGLPRQPGSFPVQYLGANIPQAWAAGSIFQLIQAILGLRGDAPNKRLLVHPTLPHWLPDVQLEGLQVGRTRLTLKFWREGEASRFEVLEQDGPEINGRRGSLDAVDVTYDVIVVGAGPAGSASASLFAEQGRRVLLVDAARFPRAKPCAEYVSPGGGDPRAAGRARTDRGRQRHRWLRGMQLRAPRGGRHLIEYRAGDGRVRRGLSVPRLVLDAAVLEVARARGAEVREGFRVRDVWHTNGVLNGVIGPQGEQLAADLVIGADGLHSVVARGVQTRRAATWPRRLGLVSHWENVDWPEDFGCMLVGPRGYVGVAPLDDAGQVSVGLWSAMSPRRPEGSAAAPRAGLAGYPELLTA